MTKVKTGGTIISEHCRGRVEEVLIPYSSSFFIHEDPASHTFFITIPNPVFLSRKTQKLINVRCIFALSSNILNLRVFLKRRLQERNGFQYLSMMKENDMTDIRIWCDGKIKRDLNSYYSRAGITISLNLVVKLLKKIPSKFKKMWICEETEELEQLRSQLSSDSITIHRMHFSDIWLKQNTLW